jgi:hypothetical protein
MGFIVMEIIITFLNRQAAMLNPGYLCFQKWWRDFWKTTTLYCGVAFGTTSSQQKLFGRRGKGDF